MMKILFLILVLLMLGGCVETQKDQASKPADTPVTQASAETEPTKFVPPEADLSPLLEICEEDSVKLLENKRYLITGEIKSETVLYGEIKDLYEFDAKLEKKLLDRGEITDDTRVFLIRVPTDQGEIPLVYTIAMLLFSSPPESVDRPVPTLESVDYSVPVSLDGAPPAVVYDIRKYIIGYRDTRDYRAMIRITSPEEYEQTLNSLSNIYEFNTYGFSREQLGTYDESWFETRDLYIASLGMGSSYPDIEIIQVVEGNRLQITYEKSDIGTDDIVGRIVLIETGKGDILTCRHADDRVYSADAYAAQTNHWALEHCYEEVRQMIRRENNFITALPEISSLTLSEFPDTLRTDFYHERVKEYALTPDTPLIRMVIPAVDKTYTAYFTKTGIFLAFFPD